MQVSTWRPPPIPSTHVTLSKHAPTHLPLMLFNYPHPPRCSFITPPMAPAPHLCILCTLHQLTCSRTLETLMVPYLTTPHLDALLSATSDLSSHSFLSSYANWLSSLQRRRPSILSVRWSLSFLTVPRIISLSLMPPRRGVFNSTSSLVLGVEDFYGKCLISTPRSYV